ncbi:MAG TPA: F0F1 ATP synthase subunit epsilon [Anaerolineae bacterium]|nr:F0F1 ATP synthase subunit epsilon [Anaerolineae bacterium]
MPIHLEIVTIERRVYSEDVDMVIAPGTEGELGILPNHTPLLTSLNAGVLRVKRGGQEEAFAIGGGIMEVLPNKIIVMADAAERSDEIDVARAERARERAEALIKQQPASADLSAALAALRRSQVRLRVAQRRRRQGVQLHSE